MMFNNVYPVLVWYCVISPTHSQVLEILPYDVQ
jgi:hypothetical protein